MDTSDHIADHIVVVDDDAEIRNLLGEYLRKNGYSATAVADGKAMWVALARGKVDLIVLDLMLPGEDGLSLCCGLRAQSGTPADTPVIMLTASGEETDRIVGLEMGADDYLAKPFSPRELLARIKSVLRRARSLPQNLRADEARTIAFAGWRLDTIARHLEEMESMVTQTLEFMRDSSAGEPVQQVDIMALLQSLQNDYQDLGSPVEIERSVVHPYSCRPLALRRCLTNLVENAIRYGKRATVRVEDGARAIIIRVLDQGPGIPESELEQAFEPFFRGEGSRSRETGGTGLGLGIARNIARSHGGVKRLCINEIRCNRQTS